MTVFPSFVRSLAHLFPKTFVDDSCMHFAMWMFCLIWYLCFLYVNYRENLFSVLFLFKNLKIKICFLFFVSFQLDTSRTPSQLERDAGFCSGGSEIGDDYQSDRIQSSPSSTDASEDSVDIKLGRILIPDKRKSFDSIKCENDVPLKKRFKYESVYAYATSPKSEEETSLSTEKSNHSDAFRPWASEQHLHQQQQQQQPLNNNQNVPNEAELLARHPGVTTLHRVPTQINSDSRKTTTALHQDEEPLALVINNKSNRSDNKSSTTTTTSTKSKTETSDSTESSGKTKPAMKPKSINSSSSNDDHQSTKSASQQQHRSASQRNCKNYKNMTRERRIEANARERTRVHTISAAFDTLRQAIPSYSNTQKLSKLSILRVACSYILTLSRMNGMDYSADQSAPSIQSCLEEITKNIQTEGKARKRKDE